MADHLILQLVPIFAFFAIGVLLKVAGFAEKSHGDFLLRLVFFVTLPLLILTTLPNAQLTAGKAMLPLANIVVNLLCLGAVLLVMRRLSLPRATQGSMVMNTMTSNNAFMFPFILSVYGESGFADAILYDFGNVIMVATITYIAAFKYSDEAHDNFSMLKRLIKSPLLWALGTGVALSVTGTALPETVSRVATPLAQMTSPLILIALGIFFSLSLRHLRLVGIALTIRMVLGLGFGLGFATMAGLEGQTFTVIALCSAAPIGFTALTFTSMAKLDMEITTPAVSLSILIGLVYIPVLILLLQ
jgi:malate permease and related proteins